VFRCQAGQGFEAGTPEKDTNWPDGIEQFRADTRHAVEPAETAKWTVFGAPRDDSLRERRSDPGNRVISLTSA